MRTSSLTSCTRRVQLTDLGLTALPANIGELSELQILSVDKNALRALPDSIGQLTKLQLVRLAGVAVTTRF